VIGLRQIVLSAVLVLCALRPSFAEEARGSARAERGMEKAFERLGIAAPESGPMSVASEELDVLRDDTGRERVVFRRNVRFEQGGLRLGCDWLEVIYPKGTGGKPDRITARGAVKLTHADSEARCTEAIFDNGTCTAVCSSSAGPAMLRRGENVIKGDEIVFDLCSGQLKVRGRARVDMNSADKGP
jgi:lipopolysaccharide export system protein LptA